jgi:hypothetical protein
MVLSETKVRTHTGTRALRFMGSIIRSLTECIPMKARRFPIRPKTSCGVRARMHQGRRWTNKLRTLTVLELEYLRVDDKTIDEMILSSLLHKVRLGPVCESFEPKLHDACMTAMISGPRYGSTSELQGAADATESRTKTIHVALRIIPERDKKMCTHPKEGPARFRITCLRPGNSCRSSVLYRVKHDNATWGVVRERWQVPPRFLRLALRHHSQARGSEMIPSTRRRPPIGRQKRIPQNELEPRTTFLRPKGMVAFMDNVIIELPFAQSRAFSVCPTWT